MIMWLWMVLMVVVTRVVSWFLLIRCRVHLIRICLFRAMPSSLIMHMLLFGVLVSVAWVSRPAFESPVFMATTIVLLLVLCVLVTVRENVHGPIRLAPGSLLCLMSTLQKCRRLTLMLLTHILALKAMDSGRICRVGRLVGDTLSVELATT